MKIWSCLLLNPVPLYLPSVQALKNQRWATLRLKVVKGSSYLWAMHSHERLKIFKLPATYVISTSQQRTFVSVIEGGWEYCAVQDNPCSGYK